MNSLNHSLWVSRFNYVSSYMFINPRSIGFLLGSSGYTHQELCIRLSAAMAAMIALNLDYGICGIACLRYPAFALFVLLFDTSFLLV